jgi:hypothetical protein
LQAHILQHLLFEMSGVKTNDGDDVPLKINSDQQQAALIHAMSVLLEKVRSSGMSSSELANKPFFVATGKPTSALQVMKLTSRKALEAFLIKKIKTWQSPHGILLFVYSLLLTRGVTAVKGDMDDPNQSLGI